MAKEKKKAKAKRERRERRFLPQSTGNPLHVKILGGVGAGVLGAGSWAQFGHTLMNNDLPPYVWGPWVLGGGAALLGVAVWLGTSGEPALHVGSGGIALEKGQLQRMPWHAIEEIRWDHDRELLKVRGADDEGKSISLTINPQSHPQAVAWILKEARDRIPAVVEAPDELRGVPPADANAGELIILDAVQVVGKHCGESGIVIAYEPDARVCPKCERVYHKHHVQDECDCGTSLASMQPTDASKATDEAVATAEDKSEPAREA